MRMKILFAAWLVAASCQVAFSQEGRSSSDADRITSASAVISIPQNGEFWFGGDRITQAEIPGRLKEALKDKPRSEQLVYIRAGLNVSYDTVVSVIDTIKAGGFDQIGLVTISDSTSKAQGKSRAANAGKGKKMRRRRHTRRK